jgi:hypothetical protein
MPGEHKQVVRLNTAHSIETHPQSRPFTPLKQMCSSSLLFFTMKTCNCASNLSGVVL